MNFITCDVTSIFENCGEKLNESVACEVVFVSSFVQRCDFCRCHAGEMD